VARTRTPGLRWWRNSGVGGEEHLESEGFPEQLLDRGAPALLAPLAAAVDAAERARIGALPCPTKKKDMSPAVSWHNFTMHLRIGDQSVRVLALEQRDVYADVIEGVPNAHINAGIVADALARAGHRHGGSPCLVPPRVRPLRSSAEPKEVLPRVCCIARVRGAPPRDPAADHGEACLVWFQDDVTTTIAPNVADALGGLVWSDIATDVHW
jgi:hypothetical protein